MWSIRLQYRYINLHQKINWLMGTCHHQTSTRWKPRQHISQKYSPCSWLFCITVLHVSKTFYLLLYNSMFFKTDNTEFRRKLCQNPTAQLRGFSFGPLDHGIYWTMNMMNIKENPFKMVMQTNRIHTWAETTRGVVGPLDPQRCDSNSKSIIFKPIIQNITLGTCYEFAKVHARESCWWKVNIG